MTNWYESQIDKNKQIDKESSIWKKLEEINHSNVLNDIKNIIEVYPDIALESLNHLVEYATIDRLKEVVSILNHKLETATQKQQQKQQQHPHQNSDAFAIDTNNTSTPKATSSRSTSSVTAETSPNTPSSTSSSSKLEKQTSSSSNSHSSRK